MTDYPPGPLPDLDDLEARVCEVMSDVGIANLSLKALRKRLEGHYKINLTPHRAGIQAIVQKALGRKEFQKTLAIIQKQRGEAAAGGKGRKGSKGSKGSKERMGSKPKPKKPADYPKARLSAYFLFMKEARKKILAEDASLSVQAVAKRAGEMWQGMNEAQRRPYQEASLKDKERHAIELEAYVAGGGAAYTRDGKRKRTADPDAPKRPLSAYFFFLSTTGQR